MTIREAILRRPKPPAPAPVEAPAPEPDHTVVDGDNVTAEAGAGLTVTAGQSLLMSGGSITGGRWTTKPAWYPFGTVAAALGETIVPVESLGGPGILLRDATAVITGGTVTGSSNPSAVGIGLLALGGSTVEIGGGHFLGHRACHFAGNGTLEITGGVFRSPRTPVRTVGEKADMMSRAYSRTVEFGSFAVALELGAGGVATIAGGEFSGAVGGLIAHLAGKLTISGGLLGGTLALNLAPRGTVTILGRSLSLQHHGHLRVLTGVLQDGSPIRVLVKLDAGALVQSSPTRIVWAGRAPGLPTTYPAAVLPQQRSRVWQPY